MLSAPGRRVETRSPTRSFDSVTAYLSWDHERFARILSGVSRAVDHGQMDRARRAYREFGQVFRRHMLLEETLLFPLFEARTGGLESPTALMRTEHREMLKAVEMMGEGLSAGSAEGFRTGLGFLQEVMPGHTSKEERILYPAIDNFLSAPERASVVARLASAG